MKNTYLVHIILPDVFTSAFYLLLPEQRDLVNKLMESRTIMSYSLDMERKNIWTFIEAASEDELMDLLSSFPIIKHVKVRIHELAYHDEAPFALPELIMN
jgi:hypothetical protein